MRFTLLALCAVLPVTLPFAQDEKSMLLQTKIIFPTKPQLSQVAEPPTRILFVGNSFTYVHDLPHQLKHISESLGKSIEVANVTISGSYLLRTSTLAHTNHLLKQDWDYIVLQDFSLIPTLRSARTRYLLPALKLFGDRKKKAKVVMYMTWGYQNGLERQCPYGGHYNIGMSLAEISGCKTSKQYQEKVGSYPCMQYSLARGALSMLGQGADIVAPCGLAWQGATGSIEVPQECKRLIDDEYDSPLPVTLGALNATGALLRTNPQRPLYIIHPDGTFDKHPNRVGQYLNALVFYTTLFGKSPVGAAAPLETQSDEVVGARAEAPLSESERAALQELALMSVRACGKACGLTTDTIAA